VKLDDQDMNHVIRHQPRRITMSSVQVIDKPATRVPTAGAGDMKLEVVVIPVSDIDRAKRFYGDLGWRLDADFTIGNDFRGVQLTPPGSPCSIQFGTGLTSAVPGSVRGLYLVVSDIEAARAELVDRGIDTSEVFHRAGPGQPPLSGPDPQRRSYASFATFSDPDGNSWLLQEIKARLPGRGFSNMDIPTLTGLLQEAEKRHGEYESIIPKHHWSEWYAAYIVARQGGGTSEAAAKDAAVHIKGEPE
jgi:catechol 2,3-dioxygenase-like lactoylglutathione lyase family enzyme